MRPSRSIHGMQVYIVFASKHLPANVCDGAPTRAFGTDKTFDMDRRPRSSPLANEFARGRLWLCVHCGFTHLRFPSLADQIAYRFFIDFISAFLLFRIATPNAFTLLTSMTWWQDLCCVAQAVTLALCCCLSWAF